MSEIIETLYEMEGVSKVLLSIIYHSLCRNYTKVDKTEHRHVKVNAGEKAAMIFGDLDIDGNGTVDEDEFIK